MKRLILIFLLLVFLSSHCNGFMLQGKGHTSAGGGSYTATYRSSTVTSVTTNPTTTTKPTGTIDGDIMIATMTTDTNTNNVTPPTGWTQIDAMGGSQQTGWSYYRIADTEGADYEWSGINPGVIHLVTVQKTGGTWTVPTTANYHSVTSATSTTITTLSVTAIDNSVLICGFGHDNGVAVSSAPADMTAVGETISGAMAHASYYEDISSGGATTKSITWSGSDELSAYAIIAAAE